MVTRPNNLLHLAINSTHVSHPLKSEGRRVGSHVALEVDVVPRPQVVGVQVAAQPQRYDGGV